MTKAILSAQASMKFRKFCNSFARFSHKICVISTPRVCFFESERTMDPAESFGDIILFGNRMLAEMNEFCARGAPKFRKFCIGFFPEKFARISRDLDAGRALFRNLNKLPTSLRAAATLRESCSARWPSARIFSCERHAEIPQVLHFFRTIFYATFA